MNILFIHPNIPGQYKHLIRHYAENPANKVVFICKEKPDFALPNVHKVEYRVAREPAPTTHRYLIGAERAVLQGQEVWRICRKLKDEEGFTPDVICCHPGWGDGLYLKDIYPDVPLLSYFEFYYQYSGADVNFDPELPATVDDAARVRTKNVTNLQNLVAADWGIAPTHWQRSTHPKEFQSKISVIHEGIDTDIVTPSKQDVTIQFGDTKLKKGDPIVTYVTRNFEHYRGSHHFIRAVKQIQEMHPTAHVIAVGADNVSYGRNYGNDKPYRHQLLEEVKPDMSRLHFPGHVDYDAFLKILQISQVHVYLTVPFVLSWSMLEAMSAGCCVVGSDTAPVREVLEDGKNGLLVDFFSPDAIAKKAVDVLNNSHNYDHIRKAARQTIIDRYDLKKLLPLQCKLIEQIAQKQFPPPVQKEIDALYDDNIQLRLAS